MVVAVVLVDVVQPPVDQEVRVVAMRHRLVPAPGAVDMAGLVAAGRHGVTIRMLGVDLDDVLVDMAVVRMMQMTVVQIVDVITVPDRGMPAARAVNVVMPIVDLMVVMRHAQRRYGPQPARPSKRR